MVRARRFGVSCVGDSGLRVSGQDPDESTYLGAREKGMMRMKTRRDGEQGAGRGGVGRGGARRGPHLRTHDSQ